MYEEDDENTSLQNVNELFKYTIHFMLSITKNTDEPNVM